MISPRVFADAGDCLVTGGTGLVGNNVVRQLLGRGHGVRVLVRSHAQGSAADRALAGLAVERFTGGLDDDGQVRRALEGAAFVVHAAAVVHCGWRHLDEMRRVNVEGTRAVARAARLAGARLVHVSSVDAIGLTRDGSP